MPGDHGIQLVTRCDARIVIDAYIPTKLGPAWDPFTGGYEELRMSGFGMWTFMMRNDIQAWLKKLQ